MSAFEAVIGLEVHVQLATRSKMFCAATHAFGQAANTQVDALSAGLPGSLPVVNGAAIELAVRAGLSLGCEIHEYSKFDRKHYFYPDLPKGYQISQYDEPYCTGGGIAIIGADGNEKFVPLTRIHMEEDAGKLIHLGGVSQVDLNRAGTPLCEIVTEPALADGGEAYRFLTELRRTLQFCRVSDCEMQEGSLRCDANVSVRRSRDAPLGTKVEIKNLNSFRAVEAAIAFEIEQQTALCRAGRGAEIVQCTKLWNPDRKMTELMRGKEGAADYRYFPDPDLPPVHISAAMRQRIAAELPELPVARQARFEQELGLRPDAAAELTATRELADYVEALIAAGAPATLAANWTREEALRQATLRKQPIEVAAPVAVMAELIELVAADRVARVVAKDAADELFASGQTPMEFFTQRGQLQQRDDAALQAWVAAALAEHPQVAEEIRSGNHKAAGRLVGVIMKASGGRANPKAVTPEIFAQLDVEL